MSTCHQDQELTESKLKSIQGFYWEDLSPVWKKTMEAVVGHLEVDDHDDELEPLDTEPPLMIILVCDWIYTKMFGSCINSKPGPSRQSSVVSDI